MLSKRSLLFVFLGALIVVVSSCWKGGADKAAELAKGFVVVNILDKELFDDCHIKGSVSLPFDKINEAEKLIDKNAEVVTYCSNYMCTASSEARKQLMSMGYKKVYVYEGGTAEWYQKGYPVVGPCAQGYLKIKLPKPEVEQDYMISAEELKKKLEENKKV